MSFAVVLRERDARDPVPLAKALAALRRTPLQDQVLAARNAWGIVAQGLSEADAGALAGGLGAAGVSCLVCPVAALVEPPRVEPAVKLSDLPEGAARLIAVAAVTVTTETKGTETRGPTGAQKVLSTAISLGTGLPIKIGGRTREVEVTREEKSITFYADVCYPERRLRIAASKFDYSCLGPRKLFQAQANLKLLIGDLVAASPAAWRNHGTRVLLEARPIQQMGYGSLKDLDKEERWLLTLQSLAAQGA